MAGCVKPEIETTVSVLGAGVGVVVVEEDVFVVELVGGVMPGRR
jgi:hypothetical protein